MSNPAETYEQSIVPYLFQPWATRLIERVDPREGERLLDVACGTGIVAREAAPRVGAQGFVAGVDLNPMMLAVAEEAAKREGVPVEWHEGDAQLLPFPDARFDIVFCQQGLQFMPDKRAALEEMRRVLAPGGRIAVSVWQDIEQHPFFYALDEVMRTRLGVRAAAAPFGLGDPDELRRLLATSGFEDVEIDQASATSRYPDPERNLYETIDALAAVAPALQGLNEEEREAMIEEISQEMDTAHQAVVDGDHVVLTWHANIAIARRAA